MTPFKERADRAVAKLKTDIEALATEVRSSDGALNDVGDQHFVIANGAVKPEGEARVPWPGLEKACADSLAVATTLSAHHRGDSVTLFWRILPEWEIAYSEQAKSDQPGLYLRLSFAINAPPKGA